jgi:trans-aconitate methyltransferase
MDDSWRRIYDDFLVSQFLPLDAELPARLEAGCSAVDIGCGSGHAVNLMAGAYPRSEFTGYDIGEDAIEAARAEAARLGLSNARFEVLDVTQLPAEPQQDVIFAFDAIHDQVDPHLVLRRVAGALKPDGIFYAVDFKFASDVAGNLDNPFAPMCYGTSLMHCMTVSLAEGGAGLGTVWGVELATQMLHDAGFANVQVRDTPRPQNCSYISRF